MITEFPNAKEIEDKVLGSMLMNFDEKIYLRLKSAWFVNGNNKQLFKAMAELYERHEPVDMVMLNTRFPTLDPIELAELMEQACPSNTMLDGYIRTLQDYAVRRALQRLSEKLCDEAKDLDSDVLKTAQDARESLRAIDMTYGSEEDKTDELVDLYSSLFEESETDAGILTGLTGLDRLIGGYFAPRLYVVGARPSVGKTVFGMVAALQAAKSGKRVLYVNREMDKRDLYKRMMANIAGVPLNNLNSIQHDEAETEKLMDGITVLNSYPIEIANRLRTPEEIRAKVQKMADEEDGIGLVVIDYLQRLSPGRRLKSRDEEVGYMSWMIKDICMDFHVPCILLSQLSRAASNTRPTMAMLRESGNIEQDADVVILLHRPDPDQIPSGRRNDYLDCASHGATYLEIIVDKNRHGQCDILPTAFLGSYMKYREL